MSRPPLIAVIGAVKDQGGSVNLTVPALYVEAVERAGGQPAVLHPVSLEPGAARERLRPFAGLLLMGGGDVDPSFYSQPPGPHVYGVDSVRDAFEIEMVRAAIDMEIPVLAICRGLQVLNVALGGTLDQHITDRPGLEPHGTPGGGAPALHPVRLDPESKLAQVMGVDHAISSCHHHQAIAELGEGLTPVAWAEDGIIEAVESPRLRGYGVQWHPEDTAAEDPAQQRLFDALVQRTVEVRA